MKSKSVAKRKAAKKTKLQKIGKSIKAPSFVSPSTRDVWPMERDVLFRPDRFKYVRKLVKPEGCVFCTAGKGVAPQFETLCLFQTTHSMVMLNKFPYNSGHLLVLPRRHCGHILELSEAEWNDLQSVVRRAFAALEKAYVPGGINMGLNHGAVAGAGLPEHLHYHLVPRWAGDLNFFPLIADTKVVVETLEQSFERLLPYF